MTRRKRLYRYEKNSGPGSVSFTRKLAIAAIMLFMTVAVYLICFVGRVPVGPHIKPTVRVISSIDFEYVSEIATKEARERAAKRVPPVYDIVSISDETLNSSLLKLVSLLNERQLGSPESAESPATESPAAMSEEAFIQHVKRATGFSINEADLPYIFSETTPINRQKLFWLVLSPLKEIINDGIFRDNDDIFAKSNNNVAELSDSARQRRSQSEARMRLMERMESLGFSDHLSGALYRIFNQKLAPNMIYNEAETKNKIDKFVEKIGPQKITIREGDIINDPTRKDRFAQERWTAYRREIDKNQAETSSWKEFIREIMVSFVLISSAALFIKISRSSQTREPKTIVLFSTLLLFNLGIERILVQASDTTSMQSWYHAFAYGMPIIIGPIIQVLLCSPYTGFVMSLILMILSAMMLGQNVGFFAIVFASALLAIYVINGAQTRRQVFLGGTIYGFCVGLFSFILGIAYGYDYMYLLKLGGLAIVSGFLTAVAAMLLLPLIERIFKMSSNITLLEFTDYNNPLLRMLQMEAPGTYHHSLMVAQIAELAAMKIGANHLVCAIGGLYHDIGKVIKPEFFSENQAAVNPHDTQSPTMSALIIKSHIREGLDLAKKYKMPPPVIRAIEEHHGNAIISYFYNKALKAAGGNASKSELLQSLRDTGIEESTFRHEGQRPQSTETAILMLADSCEAASRALRRVTPHSIEELVDAIFQTKMNDNQLDESPITLRQIAKVRESFIFTLQNMLHSRVEYNNGPSDEKKDAAVEDPKSNHLESQKPQD